VFVGDDHEVTGGVRIQIKDNEIEPAAIDNQMSRVAKYASGIGRLLLNVLIAPGTPEVVHTSAAIALEAVRRQKEARRRLVLQRSY
jgi:hypothetical protein